MAFSFGSGINAGLGRVDFSEIAQGGRSTAQGIANTGNIKGQSMANLGQGIANSIQQYQTKKQQSEQYKSIAKAIASNEGLAKQFGIKKDSDGTYDEAGIYSSIKTLGTPEAVGNFVLNAGIDLQRKEEQATALRVQEERNATAQRIKAEQDAASAGALGRFLQDMQGGGQPTPTLIETMNDGDKKIAVELLKMAQPKESVPSFEKTILADQLTAFEQTNGRPANAQERAALAMEIRRNGAPARTYPTPQEEGQTRREITAADHNEKLWQAGFDSQKTIADIDQALALLDSVPEQGALGNLIVGTKQLGARIGLNMEGIENAEQLRVLLGNFMLQRVQETKGSVSDKEMDTFSKISPNLLNTPEGNRVILEFVKQIEARKRIISQMIQKKRDRGKSAAQIRSEIYKWVNDEDNQIEIREPKKGENQGTIFAADKITGFKG
jgi:hypothetical protein